MAETAPPVPDAKMTPKPSQEMADEGEREGPVQIDASQPDEDGSETSADPQFAQNGD